MRGGLLAVVALALGLRLGRAALRWDEVALAYAAYTQAWIDAAAAGDLRGVIGTFVGLHPPLHAALMGASELLWGAPAGWLLLSVLASTGAVWLVGRSYGLAAAAALATDPLQLAYAAEVNNYPLLVLAVALCAAGRERAVRRGRWGLLAAAGVMAGWTHLLGGLVGGLFALSLLRRDRRAGVAVLGVMALGTLPVLARAAGLAGGEDAYAQGGLAWGQLIEGLSGKLGWWWPAWGLAALGAWRRPALLGVALPLGVGITAMMALGVAASHQQPYWLTLGPLIAGLLGARPLLGLGVAVAGLIAAEPELEALRALHADLDRPRAIDAALADAEPGDALWLLAPALMPDDDKRDRSEVLWRLPPWRAGGPWRGEGSAPAFEFSDYRWGQPRWMSGQVVHTSTDLHLPSFDAALALHLDAGRAARVVLYDHAPAYDYEGKLRRALRPYAHRCVAVGADVGLGRDLLCVVQGRAAEEPEAEERR